jgi:hypothetical protein
MDDLHISHIRPASSGGSGRRRRRTQSQVAAKFDLTILSNTSNTLDNLTQQIADPTSTLHTGSISSAIKTTAASLEVAMVCPKGMMRPIGASDWECSPCADPGKIPNYPDQTLCVACPFNQVSNAAGDDCVCMDNTYNASTGLIACYAYGESYSAGDFLATVGSADSHCRSCVDDGLSTCVACTAGAVTVKPGYSAGPAQDTSQAPLGLQSGSRPVFACAMKDQCLGEATSVAGPSIRCSTGYAGPLCTGCASDYSRRGLDHCRPCKECKSTSVAAWTAMFAMALIAVSVATFMLMRVKPPAGDESQSDTVQGSQDRSTSSAGRLALEQGAVEDVAMLRAASTANAVTSARTYIGLTQILTGMQFAFGIQFPSVFTSILDLLKLMALDVLGTIQLGCLGSWTFYHKFTVTALSPLLLGAMLLLFYRIHVGALPAGSAAARQQLDRALKFGFNAIFLIYPMVSQTVFQSFKCQALDAQHEYLQVDFQTDCNTVGYVVLVVLAVPMVLLYPVGIPAGLFALMWKNRAELGRRGSQTRQDFAPLVESYRLDCWYWCGLPPVPAVRARASAMRVLVPVARLTQRVGVICILAFAGKRSR